MRPQNWKGTRKYANSNDFHNPVCKHNSFEKNLISFTKSRISNWKGKKKEGKKKCKAKLPSDFSSFPCFLATLSTLAELPTLRTHPLLNPNLELFPPFQSGLLSLLQRARLQATAETAYPPTHEVPAGNCKCTHALVRRYLMSSVSPRNDPTLPG